MTTRRRCQGMNERGEPCAQAPQLGNDFCFWHDPENEKDAAEARRLGGLNRKRERTLQEVYDVDGIATVEQIQRVLEIAISAALGHENTLDRARVLIQAANAANQVLKTGDLEKRLKEVESVLQPRLPRPEEKKRGWWRR